jgi:hypothetical protein
MEPVWGEKQRESHLGCGLKRLRCLGVSSDFFKRRIRKYLGSEHVLPLNLHMLIFRLILLISFCITHEIE